MNRYSDEAISPLVLIMPRMSGYVKIFKFEDKNSIDDEKLFEKYKTICTQIEDLQILNQMLYESLMIEYIKTKIRTCSD